MSKKKIAFITTTALFCLAILPGAVMDLIQPEMVVEIMEKLGMPLYVLTLIGVWKLLGVVALALPKRTRLNEWAYAGFFFDLTGAAYSHAAAGDIAGVPAPLIILAVLGVSYFLRPAVFEASGG